LLRHSFPPQCSSLTAAAPNTLQRLQWNQYTVLQAAELVATGECSDYVVGVQLNSLAGPFEEGRLELGSAGTRCYREVEIRGSTTVTLRLSSYECRDQMEDRVSHIIKNNHA
jgi:hypothetical protein